jgi:hypothetical protein
MSNERVVTFLRGVGTSIFVDTDRDAVDSDFGPFDIGPCCEWVGGRYAVSIRSLLDILFDVICNGVELCRMVV